jgi:hypothetical protein
MAKRVAVMATKRADFPTYSNNVLVDMAVVENDQAR